MSTPSTTDSLGRRSRPARSSRPERIDIDSDVLVRNDILAAEKGVSERTLNRDPKAPRILHGGVLYRPERAYNKHLASLIEHPGQEPQRRRRHRPDRTKEEPRLGRGS